MIDQRAEPALASNREIRPGDRTLRRTRFAFFCMCCYLAAQVAYFPLAAVGPSWAVWPTPPDLAVILLGIGFIVSRRRIRIIPRAGRQVWAGLLFILIGTVGTFLVAGPVRGLLGMSEDTDFAGYGLFQIYRTLQFALVFRVAAGVPLSRHRLNILARIADLVLSLVAVSVIATFTSALPTSVLVSRLPADAQTAGAWSFLSNQQRFGTGTIGYDHAYTALQLIMLLALRSSLHQRKNLVLDTAFLILTAAAVFLTESRSGLAAMLVYMVTYFVTRPGSLLVAALMCGCLTLLVGGMIATWAPDLGETIERGLTLQHPLEGDSLSGRQDIWKDTMALLGDDSVGWIAGKGPGYVIQYSRTAHSTYLQTLTEFGLVGLLALLFFIYKVFRLLRRYEIGAKPVLTASLAFLLTSFTQETFYPVTFLGHFLGLYLFSLAIVFSISHAATQGMRANATEASTHASPVHAGSALRRGA